MSEVNKAIVRRLFEECFNQHNLDLHPEFYSEGFVQHTAALGDLRRPEHRQLLASIFTAFSDARWTVLDQVSEGDQVVTRWTLLGTHTGTFMGIAGTGRPLNCNGMCIDRFADGKIAEEWEEWDTLGMMQQLGALPLEANIGDMVAP
jgi:steroid delta-isomerase-like uncharacterized protein